jgi:hypothetical protein
MLCYTPINKLSNEKYTDGYNDLLSLEDAQSIPGIQRKPRRQSPPGKSHCKQQFLINQATNPIRSIVLLLVNNFTSKLFGRHLY